MKSNKRLTGKEQLDDTSDCDSSKSDESAHEEHVPTMQEERNQSIKFINKMIE